jgi:hypothetical protein
MSPTFLRVKLDDVLNLKRKLFEHIENHAEHLTENKTEKDVKV